MILFFNTENIFFILKKINLTNYQFNKFSKSD